jgi:hypothetical protein
MLFGLIAYFGGFATAIYYLAPAAANAATAKQKQSIQWNRPARTAANTEKCGTEAEQFKEKMRSAVAFAEEKARQVVEMYKAHAAAAEQNKNLQAAAD